MVHDPDVSKDDGCFSPAGPSPISVLPDDEQVWASVEVVDHATGPKKIDIPTGVRIPPSKRYEYYRYYGFAGCGAKTSWAHNPAKQPVQHASAAYDSAGWGYNGRRVSRARYMQSTVSSAIRSRAV